jgi:hypothetical protein
MMIVKRLALLAAGLAVGTSAFAQMRAGKGEIYLFPVFTTGQTYSFEGGATAQTDTGYGFGLGFGKNFTPNLAAGVDIQWGSSDYRSTVLPGPGNGGQPVSVRGSVDSSTVRFHGTYYLGNADLAPFITGGLGWTYIDSNVPSGPPQGVCWWYPWWGQVCGSYIPTATTTKFSYNVGLGLRQDFRGGMFVRGLVNNQWVDIASSGTSSWTQWRIDVGWRY